MLMILYSFSFFFFFNDTATTEIYTLPYTTLFRSPLSGRKTCSSNKIRPSSSKIKAAVVTVKRLWPRRDTRRRTPPGRSEEHTSELQSQSNLVCRLLLEKKKRQNTDMPSARHYAQS